MWRKNSESLLGGERFFLPKCGINGHDWYDDNNNRGCQVRTPDVTGGNHSCQFKMESESVDGENKGPKDHANITYMSMPSHCEKYMLYSNVKVKK